MFRAVKANGWNAYKIQKRFLYFFWLDIDKKKHIGKGVASAIADAMNELAKR